MGFDDDWAAVMSASRDRQSAGTRINSAGPEGAGSGPMNLVVTQDDLGAVGHEAYLLHEQLRKGADIAGAGSDKSGAGSTAQAARELSSRHMTMGGELLTALSVWDSQVKTVLQMCAHISNHLDYSKRSYAQNDRRIEDSLRHRDGTVVPVSEISTYVR
ncbi:hypothetical protein [Streptomyces sp. NK15101]|uniref:hypothetical protein n=1 Tax=Streptomyces sp. NK15101 TaxID=2873261 RepID=UPI001CEC16EC|nr:hypothetical protein [Streptomyces sp. NK15101]